MRSKLFSVLALFTSTGTLLCCAIPAALAAVAGGAAIAAYVSAVPWVIPLSRHKGWIFLVAGTLIALNVFLLLHGRRWRATCAVDGGGCETAGRFTRSSLWLAAAVYGVGAFMTYGVVPLLELVEK